MKCQFYLRSHPQYDSVQQFKELGICFIVFFIGKAANAKFV